MCRIMSVGNRGVVSCDLSRGIITTNVLSDFKHSVKGQDVCVCVCVSARALSPSEPGC